MYLLISTGTTFHAHQVLNTVASDHELKRKNVKAESYYMSMSTFIHVSSQTAVYRIASVLFQHFPTTANCTDANP